MDKIVQSLASVLITQALAPFDINERALGESGIVLCRKIEKMPLLIRISIHLATFIFDWAGFFYGGRRFCDQNKEQQQKMLNVIQQYRWYPLRQFLRFYQKFSLYIYYSLLEELK